MADFVFLTVDWLGALFSLLALRECLHVVRWILTNVDLNLVTQNTFDALGGVLYILW